MTDTKNWIYQCVQKVSRRYGDRVSAVMQCSERILIDGEVFYNGLYSECEEYLITTRQEQ